MSSPRTLVAVAIAALGLGGCAQLVPPAQELTYDVPAADEATCASEAQCQREWQIAERWIIENVPEPVTRDVYGYLATAVRRDSDQLGAEVRMQRLADGSYRVVALFGCFHALELTRWQRCQPMSPGEARRAFDAAVKAPPLVPAAPADQSTAAERRAQ
ncbi:MAG TPA: hypothetical protein VMF64_12100 [Steroidobacteraceae bacterium]|nr:hypothetical protein [Steroidobacteraceae bacterium]